MLAPVRVSAAAVVVTLAEAKEHLRITSSDENTLVDSLIMSATEHVSERVGRILGGETWRWKFRPDGGPVALPIAPVSTLTAMTYLDQAWAVQTALVSDFVIVDDADRPVMMPGLGKAWPATAARDDAITVTLTAGMIAIPPSLRTAILLLVGHWFTNREAVSQEVMAEVPASVSSLIDIHRRKWVVA